MIWDCACCGPHKNSVYSGGAEVIVPFHKDISPGGELPEHRILAHEL